MWLQLEPYMDRVSHSGCWAADWSHCRSHESYRLVQKQQAQLQMLLQPVQSPSAHAAGSGFEIELVELLAPRAASQRIPSLDLFLVSLYTCQGTATDLQCSAASNGVRIERSTE